MLILRKDFQERVRGKIGGNFLEINACLRFAFDPEPDRGDFVAAFP
jgi:hypothetical protein